jgi:hypothetical protein
MARNLIMSVHDTSRQFFLYLPDKKNTNSSTLMFLSRNLPMLFYQRSEIGLIRELFGLITSNDIAGLEAKFTKLGRPRKGERAITQNDKDECLAQAMPSASLELVDMLISHGAKLNQFSFRRAIERGDKETELLDLMANWGWKVNDSGYAGLWWGRSVVEYVSPFPYRYIVKIEGVSMNSHGGDMLTVSLKDGLSVKRTPFDGCWSMAQNWILCRTHDL